MPPARNLLSCAGLNYSFGDAATQVDRLLYTQALWSDLHAAGVNFIPSDGNAMRRAVAAFPAAFGFRFADTAHPACTQPGGVTTAWALLCSSAPGAPSTLVTPDADRTRLFADDQHFTTAGQKIIADYEYSLVVAPSEISYLAEVPVKTRAGVSMPSAISFRCRSIRPQNSMHGSPAIYPGSRCPTPRDFRTIRARQSP
jgi:outer membrane lipase/esterase